MHTHRPSNDWRVYKFGGTSVQDAGAMSTAIAVAARDPKGLVVTISALGGVTDILLKAADAAVRGLQHKEFVEQFHARHQSVIHGLLAPGLARQELERLLADSTEDLLAICQSLWTLRELTRRVSDATVARGERLSAQIFQRGLQERGISSEYVDAVQFLKAQKQHAGVFPHLPSTTRAVNEQILPLLERGKTVVIPGFIATGPDGELTTLGRGGSDLTATVVAACIGAKSVTLYKEVDGLMTADPRHVSEARVVPELHFREAAELAYYGAKVLHPRTIIPLLDPKIPLWVKSTFQPDAPGTRIAHDVSPGQFPVKALTASLGQTVVAIEGKGMLGVPGIAARTFAALAQHDISVSMISQASSEASICFVVPDAEAHKAQQALRDAFAHEIERHLIDDVRALGKQAVIAAVGLGMKGTPGIAARTFQALANARVNVEAIAQGSSELNISIAVDERHVKAALTGLHREFRLEKLRALPPGDEGGVGIAIFGLGQIGRALSKQILSQRDYFAEKMHLKLGIVAAVDTSGLALEENGFSEPRMRELVLQKERGGRLTAGGKMTLQKISSELKDRVFQLPLNKPILVDTSADETAPLILAALSHGWNVVVANKKPLAVQQGEYDELFKVARQQGVHLRYEATVGAGLPILDTLAKLEEAGDEVHEIAGCFSGTLGFLMTELGDGTLFSEAVRKAHALGYTEPDPREDLSGMDVARKALILARTLGIRLNPNDIAVETLFPESASSADPKQFIDNLRAVDQLWADKIQAAKRASQELRYVARITRSGVTVGVSSVPSASPFGRLRGTDNQVTVSSKRYATNPLIVTGPGAGADVTAAGVLNDILAVAASRVRRKGGA